MELLRNVVAAVQQEIQAALAKGTALPAPVLLEADRVTVSLSLSIMTETAPDGAAVVHLGILPIGGQKNGETPLHPRPHTVTVEFKVAQHRSNPDQEVDQAQPRTAKNQVNDPARLDPIPTQELTDSLTAILGTPGFDSSARATVLREALAGLSDEQVRALSRFFRGDELRENSPATVHARHLLNRLVETGRVGPNRGRALLAGILDQYTIPLLVHFLEDIWKTQDDWLD